MKHGWLKAFDPLEECETYLGAKPVLSKFANIKVQRWSAERGKFVAKSRLIMDGRRSNVTAAATKQYKSELPRCSDSCFDILELKDTAILQPEDDIEQVVADTTDAFWQLPLHPAEQNTFVLKCETQLWFT